MSEQKLKWYEENGKESDVVISSRVRLARNVRKYPFPPRMTAEQERELLKQAEACTAVLDKEFPEHYMYCSFNRLTEYEKTAMVERHIVSPAFAGKEAETGIILSEDESAGIMINEEDHIRIQAISCGMNMSEVWEKANRIDDLTDAKLEYAYDRKYGYLTSCLTNVGTGLRASYMMFLPALTHTDNINRISEELAGYGIALRGIYGEGTQALGDIYQISNQRTLGSSEQEIIDGLDYIVDQVIKQERIARDALYSRHFDELEDQICRSYGVLKYARMLSSTDAVTLLGQIKLGLELGIIKMKDAFPFYKLVMNVQRANLQMAIGQNLGNAGRDRYRADYIRSNLSELL